MRLKAIYAKGMPLQPDRKQADMTSNADWFTCVCYFFRFWEYVSLCIFMWEWRRHDQGSTLCMCIKAWCVLMDINNPLFGFQINSKYRQIHKYKISSSLNAVCASCGYPLTCTTQSQYDTQPCIMKHFVVFNTQEPSVERPSSSNIGLRQEDIIVIKNNI